MTHSTPCESIRKVTSLSLVAFERSIEVDPKSARNRSKLSAWTQIRDERTKQVASDVEGLEGMRTLPHQPDY